MTYIVDNHSSEKKKKTDNEQNIMGIRQS
jgi:hypothetical protein